MTYLATMLMILSVNILTETNKDTLFNQCVALINLAKDAPAQELKYVSDEAIDICIKRMDD